MAVTKKLGYYVSLLALSITCMATPQTAQAQEAKYAVKGTVTEVSSGQGLGGASVYLAKTTLGSATNANGYYRINNIPPGVYDLVFSFVGYKRVVKKLVIDGSRDTLHINTKLEQSQSELDELVVESDKPNEWLEMKKQFDQIFLGYSNNADDARIVNAEYLDFTMKNGNTLIASSSKPLVIQNQALGYRLTVDLDRFEWNLSRDIGRLVTYPKFTEMETDSRKQQRRWERNRKKTYEGSLKHFLTNLYDDRARFEGYEFNRALIKEISDSEKEFELAVEKGLPKELKNILKGYRVSKEVQIKYGTHKRNASYFGSNPQYKTSVIKPNTQSRIFFIDPWGNLLDPNSILLGGEWSSHRVADFLPFHYLID